MVLAETTDGEDTIYYLHGLDLVAQSDGYSTEYFLYDALGSVRQLADDSASPLLTQTYDPYGTVYASVGTGVSNYAYTGEQVDANGLVYLRARYYQPGMGRFLTVDPSRREVNPYQYTLGNPVNYTDPSGLGPPYKVYLSTRSYPGSSSADYWSTITDGELFYGRKAAVFYWKFFAQDYYSVQSGHYLGFGTDCANFVSQGLAFGGMQQSDEWNQVIGVGSLGFSSSQSATQSWVVVPNLFDYLVGPRYLWKYSLGKVQVGDLVFYDQFDDNSKYDHVAAVVDIVGGTPRVVEHGLDYNLEWMNWATHPDGYTDGSDICNWDRLLEEINNPIYGVAHIGHERDFDSVRALMEGEVVFVHVPDRNE